MPVPKDAVLELMRMDADPAGYDAVRELWKAHSKAEDARSIEGLMATLTDDCVYTVYPDDVSWHGHEGATRFYTELLDLEPTGEQFTWRNAIFFPCDPEARLFKGERVYTDMPRRST